MALTCEHCGARQRVGKLAPRTAALCVRCGILVDSVEPMDLTLGLAWTLAIFALLFPANLLPLMQATLGSETRVNYISSGVRALWSTDWPFLAIMFAAYTIAFPFIRASLMLVVLGAIRVRRRPAWIGCLYRFAQAFELWAMSDVLVVACFVAYMRIKVQLQGQVCWGGWCLIMVAILQLLGPWCLSPHRIWREIMPDRPDPGGDSISCVTCNMILPASFLERRCPRCWKRLHRRKPDALVRTAALVAAGYILYFPAYYYPMSYTLQPGGVQYVTIIDGVRDLINAGFWYLAIIIIIASILIPLLKLTGLSWMLIRVRFPSKRRLVLRTRVFHIIHRIGRWSNVDPFIVALMAPLFSFPGVADVYVGKAALPFALVVACTMLAARSFDSRLMWDAAQSQEDSHG